MLTEFLENIEVLTAEQVKVWDEKLEQYAVTKEAQYRTQTILKTRPPTESQARLDMVINLGKPQHIIDMFITGVNLGIAWDWCEKYITYLNDVDTWEKWQAVQTLDSEGKPLPLAVKPDAPVKPIKPPTLTVEQFKAENPSLFNLYKKKQGIKINGYQVSLNKDNSDGLVSIKAGYELAGATIFPTNFIADNASGTVSIKLDNFEEFTSFALQFLAARNALFN